MLLLYLGYGAYDVGESRRRNGYSAVRVGVQQQCRKVVMERPRRGYSPAFISVGTHASIKARKRSVGVLAKGVRDRQLVQRLKQDGEALIMGKAGLNLMRPALGPTAGRGFYHWWSRPCRSARSRHLQHRIRS